MSSSFFFYNLASAILIGKWSLAAIVRRASEACLVPSRNLRRLLRPIHAEYLESAKPSVEVLALQLRSAFLEIPAEQKQAGRLFHLPDAMCPQGAAAQAWGVPAITTEARLAAWLGMDVPRLRWLADLREQNDHAESNRLRHFHEKWIAKKGGRYRLLETPKAKLKAVQRKILREILDRIPPHDAAHGFRRGRSVLSHASNHVGKAFVLRLDLADFFTSVQFPRVFSIFRTAGYPRKVAGLLAGLCTTATPIATLTTEFGQRLRHHDESAWQRWRTRHLPQGAPTSPALANLSAFRLDRRLAALAKKLALRYSRYADDLAFSGGLNLERIAKSLQTWVAVIAAEEGFSLQFRKTEFLSASARQILTGIVVNDKPNIRRQEYDLLKAILHNCVRFGPCSQNRDQHADFRAHLLGRIANVKRIHAKHGAKLMAVFDAISWS